MGFALSSEEHGPGDLLRDGRIAEEAGFDSLTISDPFQRRLARRRGGR